MSRMTTAILRMPDELYWMDDFMTRRQHNANRFAAADEIERLLAEAHRLHEWIKGTASQYDICTRNVLREVCDGCRCRYRNRGGDV